MCILAPCCTFLSKLKTKVVSFPFVQRACVVLSCRTLDADSRLRFLFDTETPNKPRHLPPEKFSWSHFAKAGRVFVQIKIPHPSPHLLSSPLPPCCRLCPAAVEWLMHMSEVPCKSGPKVQFESAPHVGKRGINSRQEIFFFFNYYCYYLLNFFAVSHQAWQEGWGESQWSWWRAL